MKQFLYRALWLMAGLLVMAAASGYYLVQREYSKLESTDPGIWEKDIQAFEDQDKQAIPASESVLFVGSSSIRFWFSLAEDIHPIPVIRRGFGGAKLGDITYYADRIIFPYKPKAIVLFAGSNDIRGSKQDKTPLQLLDEFKTLVHLVHQRLPETPLYYIAITPTTGRWQVWPQVQQANQLIAAYAASQPDTYFIDTTPFLLTPEGLPNEKLLWWDGVHLNKEGYKQWGNFIKKRLWQDLYARANKPVTVSKAP